MSQFCEVILNCQRGNARIRLDRVLPKRKGAQVLTGRRRKWDALHWSPMGDGRVGVQGLFRGRYADAVVNKDELIAALEYVGATATSRDIQVSCK